MRDPHCIFCQILAGDVPASVVYEDEATFAFMDIAQLTPGHTLIIPKVHVQQIYDLDQETAAALGQTLVRVCRALRAAFHPIGLSVRQANGRAAGQEVPHVHFHCIPYHSPGLPKGRRHRRKRISRAELDALAARIRAHLEHP